MTRLILTSSNSGERGLKQAGLADIVIPFGLRFVWGQLPTPVELESFLAARSTRHDTVGSHWLDFVYPRHLEEIAATGLGLIELCARCETVELWIDPPLAPPGDDPARAWDYDVVVQAVRSLATARRYNLQETLVHAIFKRIASLHGISALKVTSSKPDVYPDARGVGVEIASFRGVTP